MTEWYVVSKATDRIINVLTKAGTEEPENPYGDNYYLTTEPRQAQLDNYQWYWERP